MGGAAAAAGSGCRAGGGGAVGVLSCAEYGELQRVSFARTLWTFNFLFRGHHDLLIVCLAIIANIFVNWHRQLRSKS